MLFVLYKASFDKKWSHDRAACETMYFFVEFVCVFPWKYVSLNNYKQKKNYGRGITQTSNWNT